MELAHDRYGSGDPLVLIHGLGGSRRIWAPVRARLAEQREVIALDLPGFGGSPELASPRRPTPANLAAVVAELCAAQGLERPHVAGNSLGAWVALELAKAGRAASVCALSPAGLWPRPLGPRRRDTRGLARRLRPVLRAAARLRGPRRALLAGIIGRPERLSRREAARLVGDWLDAPGYDAANAEMRAAVFERPELVTVPATIGWGNRDRLVAPPSRERMPPGARFVVLDGCGHTPTWDDPDLVADLLLEASRDGTAVAAPARA